MTFKKFEDINISTTTVIVNTNLELNLEWFYDTVDIHTIENSDSIKTNKEFQEKVIKEYPPHGTITMIQYKDRLKGFKIRKKKKKYFRNALSIVMFVGKLITIKIPIKGKLQITGCTNDEHSMSCVKYIWELIQQHPSSTDTYSIHGDKFKAYLHTVMTDIVFNLGFHINRQNLDKFMNRNTKFNSLLEMSFGYTGVNIKIPFEIDYDKSKVIVLVHDNDNWSVDAISFKEYLKVLPKKDVDKELHKCRKNTFLVFHSGTAIMSGMSPDYMKDVYNDFVSTIHSAKQDIEETL